MKRKQEVERKQDKVRAEDKERKENEEEGVDNGRKRTYLTFVNRSLKLGFGSSFNSVIRAYPKVSATPLPPQTKKKPTWVIDAPLLSSHDLWPSFEADNEIYGPTQSSQPPLKITK
jgi:hypothetical protein